METYIAGVSTRKVDATYLHGRQGKAQQVTSRAAVVAMGVNGDGRRELLGLKVGNSETEAFWAEFISHLKERGLDGVKLVISDAHAGLTKAIRLVGAVLLEQHENWQLEGRRMFSAESMATIPELDAIPALQALSA
jgi:transposase-like protein